jgi:putative transposase
MKYAWIDQHRGEYTVSRLCRVLAVSRSGYCQWRVRHPSAQALANQALDAKVAAATVGRASCSSCASKASA